ncbi:hypothetical protein [Pseudoalteromonas luteoviolacea]|uniref:hypothetical protein n=1 Tax=Pseudoalteromonas luteoviolacea TaxID=43657 RepID=UPI001152257D|nr:hypothetical protein [Pseudoalteromonas luteoviolacea]TQF70108.1 hypothetical protein FLM44_03165 [Pseudoalteromonas luteoviolacea]
MKIELLPKQGWSTFLDSAKVEGAVFEHISIKEHGGRWNYYNFTSNTSIWELDKNLITITFDGSEEEYICALYVEFYGNEELERLIQYCTERFEFVAKYS